MHSPANATNARPVITLITAFLVVLTTTYEGRFKDML
jgi:hypothetical protein